MEGLAMPQVTKLSERPLIIDEATTVSKMLYERWTMSGHEHDRLTRQQYLRWVNQWQPKSGDA